MCVWIDGMNWVESLSGVRYRAPYGTNKCLSQIKLDREIKFKAKKVQPICLPSKFREQVSHHLTQTPTTRMRTELPTWRDGAGRFQSQMDLALVKYLRMLKISHFQADDQSSDCTKRTQRR